MIIWPEKPEEREIQKKSKGKNFKLGFRKVTIDEEQWKWWNQETQQLEKCNAKWETPTTNATKKKLTTEEGIDETNKQTQQR